MTTYLLLLSLHLVGIILWIGGMFMLALVMNAWQKIPSLELTPSSRILTAVARWNQRVTMPAMALSWLTGLGLLLLGNWPPSLSLMLKILLVLGLSALHGIQSASLRRSLGEAVLTAPAFLRHAAGLTLAASVIIILLIEFKPL